MENIDYVTLNGETRNVEISRGANELQAAT